MFLSGAQPKEMGNNSSQVSSSRKLLVQAGYIPRRGKTEGFLMTHYISDITACLLESCHAGMNGGFGEHNEEREL